ncbi:MAG: tRNA (adenosine(37)-N6)-threonylcarbamoyltransferase complex transferase subunit TsaD [Desulfamplus sp.]|nr:tRNA (adenosine(37)-N6)-threonylcarbamoyltransferase complex transferase subunit TsaD [Desulfamplus sp.]
MIILGIESSCDETAAAVVEDGNIIRSSVVSSQIAVHHKYGGVVPELASRMHIESIIPVVMNAIELAGISIDQIQGVAATRGPGLIGALLVGFSFAKSFAWAKSIPLAGVNHLEGHIYSVLLSDDPPKFPFVILLASGGHTNLYYVESYNEFELMGQTRDDAAGEAFDKVAKMLGLGYPGGAVIEKLAEKGDPFSISFPKSYLEKDSFDFSFSGLKSSVARYITEHTNCSKMLSGDISRNQNNNSNQDNNNIGLIDINDPNISANIAASFQESIIEVLAQKLISAALSRSVKHIAVAGGVAANSALKRKIISLINSSDSLLNNYLKLPDSLSRSSNSLASNSSIRAKDLKLHLPPLALCGDNAAMIAARGCMLIKDGKLCNLDSDVFSRTKLSVIDKAMARNEVKT